MSIRIIQRDYGYGKKLYILQTNRVFKVIPWFWHDYCYHNKAGSFVKAEVKDISDIYSVINDLKGYKEEMILCKRKI